MVPAPEFAAPVKLKSKTSARAAEGFRQMKAAIIDRGKRNFFISIFLEEQSKLTDGCAQESGH
jgi:hypothetical protein